MCSSDLLGENRTHLLRNLFHLITGFSTHHARENVRYTAHEVAKTLPHVRVRGLMCMAPFFDNPEEARPIFRVANALYEDMKGYFEEGQIQYLSMGMTHDFEVALEEGANIVRVGTAIFGERVYD